MKTEVYESNNRRSVIDGHVVSFLRVTGDVRRSMVGVWFTEVKSLRRARKLAKDWAFEGKLGKPVI